jgi:hypothetical protein
MVPVCVRYARTRAKKEVLCRTTGGDDDVTRGIRSLPVAGDVPAPIRVP